MQPPGTLLPPLKPLVALVKAYRGGEWLGAALESACGQCAGAVVVLADAPWRGVAGERHLPENCREPLATFQRRRPDFKVVTIRPKARLSTAEQYSAGMALIAANFGGNCGVLLLDTDEVWEDVDLLGLRVAMTEDADSLVFRAGIWTYLRSPLWRVAPKEAARVAVALARPGLPTGQSRLANVYELYPRGKIRDVPCNFHHFGYVRMDPTEITAKLANCTSQDRVPVLEDWKGRVWDRLPEGRDIHPQRGFEKCWGGVEEVGWRRFPPAALAADAFWAGLAWHALPGSDDLFAADCRAWRSEVETLPPAECPATTVSAAHGPALARLAAVLGRAGDLDWLLPRLRMSFRETVQLALLARTVPNGSVMVEIGSGLGGSMAVLMLARQPGTLLCAIDPYLPYDEENVVLDRAVKEGDPELFADTVRRTDGVVDPAWVELDRRHSADAARAAAPDSLDLLLVDGNHSYASCLEDLRLWWPAVKAGGLVLVHDYATRFPGVIRAVKEFEAEQGVRFALPLRSTLAWLRKP